MIFCRPWFSNNRKLVTALPKIGSPSGCESDVEDNIEEDSKSISESSLPVPLASPPSRIPTSVQLPETVSRLDTPFGSSVFLVGTAHFSRESQEDVATVRHFSFFVLMCLFFFFFFLILLFPILFFYIPWECFRFCTRFLHHCDLL